MKAYRFIGLILVVSILAIVLYLVSISSRQSQPNSRRSEAVSRRSETVDSNTMARTEVVATLDCPMPQYRNVIWCSTFQMAWDRFKEDITKGPIQVIGAEELAARLNKAQFPTRDLEEESYYTAAGFDKGILETIRREMARRFPSEPTPVLDQLDPGRDQFVAYAYLKVDAGFRYPFYANPRPFVFQDSNGTGTEVTSFRADTEWPDPDLDSVRGQVEVLYDRPEEGGKAAEFAIDLCRHTSPYQIVVASIPLRDTLRQTLKDLEAGITGFRDDPNYAILRKLRHIDSLIVPDILFKLMHHFKELEGRHLGNRGFEDLPVTAALQMIDFALSRTGFTLRSEASFATAGRDLNIPRLFHFNRPFLVYVKKRAVNASPFFVMWVDNTELMKPPYKATFAGGKGEPNDPYQVATAEQLLSIGTSQKLLASHYVLVNWAKCQ